jgi:DNA-binding NtrC family response regulator
MLQTRILLVDDETDFVRTLERRLSRRKISVSCASSGSEGLTRLGEDPEVDVVILDVKMPNMDGIETLREIKKRFPTVEVILLSGHVGFESATQGMNLGAFDYLMKPCDLEELVAKIDEAKLKRRRRLETGLGAGGRVFPHKRNLKRATDSHEKA